MIKRIPELLAPAGSMEALEAAVNAGADALYLSGKRFGARYYAANFNDDEIKSAVDYAHLRGVKVYVTVNTLIKDNELAEVAKYLIFLYKIGVDAVLIQDIGVASLSKKIVPDLEIHASTQMTIHNLEGVKWAAQMGFKRVVLSREMKLSEIKQITETIKSNEIEIEIFVHGALCYSYSGQCFMSSFIGGRSGNRGRCAQPCRKPYKIVFGDKDRFGRLIKLNTPIIKDEYLLSTRDLCLYDHLDEIVSSNLGALKIEGRMRSPQYVAIVVSIYRKALDSIQKGKWNASPDDVKKLKLAFNRDFTPGYLIQNNYEKIMGRNHPGNRGLFAGFVKKYYSQKREVLIETKGNINLKKGDGIVILSNTGNYGILIDTVSQVGKNKFKIKIQKGLHRGSPVYLTRSKLLLEEAHRIINDVSKEIPIDMDITIQKDGSIIIKSCFKVKDSILNYEMIPQFKFKVAHNKPLDEKTIIRQFKKTGGTPFTVRNIKISYPGGLFATIGKLNQLRRELLEKIKENIIFSYNPPEYKIKKAFHELNILNKRLSYYKEPNYKKLNLGVHVDSIDVLNAAVKSGCNIIYFNPFNIYNPQKCEENFNKLLKLVLEAFYICKEDGVEFNLKLPKITTGYFLNSIRSLLIQLFEAGVNGVMVDGCGSAEFIHNLNPSIKISGGVGVNIWNFESIDKLKEYIKCFTISPELSRDDIKNISSHVYGNDIKAPLNIIVQGNMESMVSRDCLPCLIPNETSTGDVFLGIKDIKDHIFPLKLDSECRTIILNSVELSLIDHLPVIANLGIDYITLNLEGRGSDYATKICKLYNDAINNNFKGIKKIKNNVKSISLGGITTGNFIEGISDQ